MQNRKRINMGEVSNDTLKPFEEYIIMFGKHKVVSSNDIRTIKMIYNNIIGKNFAGAKTLHEKYLEFVRSETKLNINLENCNEVKIISTLE